MTPTRNHVYQVLRSRLAVHHSREASALIALSGVICLAFSDAVLTGLVVDFLIPIPVPIIAPMLAGVAIGLGAGSRIDCQILAGRSLIVPRIIWSATLLVSACAFTATASVSGDVSAVSILRNCLIFGALGISTTIFFGPVGSWIGPSVAGLFLILFGGARPEGPPPWAFALRDEPAVGQLLFALGAYAVITLLYASAGSNRQVRVPSAWT